MHSHFSKTTRLNNDKIKPTDPRHKREECKTKEQQKERDTRG